MTKTVKQKKDEVTEGQVEKSIDENEDTSNTAPIITPEPEESQEKTEIKNKDKKGKKDKNSKKGGKGKKGTKKK
jgi:hypothetical protein